MEGSRHKGVVLRGVAEYHQLCAAQPVPLLGQLRRLLDDAAHVRHRIHIDAALRRPQIDGGADPLGKGECLGN